MKEYTQEVQFPVSVQTLFDISFRDPEFKFEYHKLRGDSDVEVKPWHDFEGGGDRVVSFKSLISKNALIQKLSGSTHANIREHQEYKYIGANELHLQSTTSFEGSALSSSFASSNEWHVSPATVAPLSCTVRFVSKNEYKGRMFKGTIESYSHEVARESWEIWVKLAMQWIAMKCTATPARAPVPTLPAFQVSDESSSSNQSHLRSTTSEYRNATPSISDAKSEAAESEYDDTEDTSSDHDVFFDTNDHWPDSASSASHHSDRHSHNHNISHGPGALGAVSTSTSSSISDGVQRFMTMITNELNHVKGVIEVNSSRLLGLEAAFHSLERTSVSGSTAGSRLTGNGGGPVRGPESPTVAQYAQRFELLLKHQEEEEKRSQEKEEIWKKKFDDLSKRVDHATGFPHISWTAGVSVVVFLLAWPVVAMKLWKYVQSFQPLFNSATVVIQKLLHKQ